MSRRYVVEVVPCEQVKVGDRIFKRGEQIDVIDIRKLSKYGNSVLLAFYNKPGLYMDCYTVLAPRVVRVIGEAPGV